MGAAVKRLSVDLETYSDVDLKKAGLYKYAQSPAFQILLFAYSVDEGPVQVIDLTKGELPAEIVRLLTDPRVIKTAFNAAFEIYCLTRHWGFDDDWAAKWSAQWRCTMLHAQYCGLPASLEAAGATLELSQDKQKLATGKALIRYFCVPCKPTKSNGGRSRNLPHHDPDRWALFIEYNRRDVETEMEIDRKLSPFPVPDDVQRQWVLDQRINLRGVRVDTELVDGALALDAQSAAELMDEACRITGLDNPNSVPKLRSWLGKEIGEDVADLRKDTVSDLLGQELNSEDARRILEIRRELGKASNKKYQAIRTAACADGRVRGMMAFYGASRTGREAGRIVQPQNLPHDVVPMEDVGRQLVREQNAAGVRLVYGSVSHTLSALIRTALTPADGCVFVDADFSAIEARVIAWLAGEEWVLEVFRTHGKIYEATASQMFGMPIDRIKKGQPEYAYRAKGKVATLALGYQGGPGALINMGALRSGIPEDELPDIVDRWRESNPSIVRFWYALERAAMEAIVSGRVTTLPPGITFARENQNGLEYMTIQLPSGRQLYYARPGTTTNRFGKASLCYWGQNGTSKKWQQVETYGGKLAENITQAVARDCLFYAMENLEAAGYRVVFDVHDEVVLEVPGGTEDDLKRVVEIMRKPPLWAPDLPLNADGWVGPWFHKD